MITIENKNKYLTPEIILPIFQKGIHNTVDKTLAGNGFTTAFTNIKSERGFLDILIAPNVAVVKGKEEKYKSEYKDGDKLMAFVYGGSEVSDMDFDTADVILFVADSFLLSIDRLNSLGKEIRNICIDEIHSTHQQSLYRKNIRGFEDKVKGFFPDVALVSVSATPIKYLDVDYRINNAITPSQSVSVTNNASESIERANALLKNGERVLIFTNNANVISRFKNRNKTINAKFVLGNTISLKLTAKAKLVRDDNSKLIIASSRGFEGFDVDDVDGEKWNVFYFENRTNEHERFYMSNLYQALSRCRNLAESIEYCRVDGSNLPNVFRGKDIDTEVDKFIADKKISVETKMSSNSKKNPRYKCRPFVRFEFDIESKKYTMVRDEVSIALHKEYLDTNKSNFEDEFSEFFKNRGISFINNKTESNSIKGHRMSEEKEVEYMLSNKDFIRDEKLVPFDFYVDTYIRGLEIRNINMEAIVGKYNKHFKLYLNRKNYDGCFTPSFSQAQASALLGDFKAFSTFYKTVEKLHLKRKKEKLTREQFKLFKSQFNDKAFASIVAQTVLMFSNDLITIGENSTAHRDYNLLTKLGMSQINLIGDYMGVKVDEFDIVSCYIRILYAICGKVLPNDVYGKDKVNKLLINKWLNKIPFNEYYDSPYRKQFFVTKSKLIELGLDKDVVDYLMDKYFDGFAGDLFNDLAYYESVIVKEAMEYVRSFYGSDGIDNDGVIRRHDSFIVFNNTNDIDLCEWSPSFFPQIIGWFKGCEYKERVIFSVQKLKTYQKRDAKSEAA